MPVHDKPTRSRHLPPLIGMAAISAALMTSSASIAAADEALADLVEDVAPSVVTILATRDAPQEHRMSGQFNRNGPMDEFFRRFGRPDGKPDSFGHQGPLQGQGSGFILESDGLIVTNHHVVGDATQITVRLSDGREFGGEIVGQDAQTDLALVQIETDSVLPFVTLGNSDEIRVGEDVVAVGNPFGLGGTVTTGIVSAKGRNIGSGAYAEFLQTDAAINKGNSGGPLFNMEGEVVGVNSAIFSPTGGSVGVGFAVTSNIVDMIVDDLRDDGQVDRGWLGVSIQDLTPDLAAAMGKDTARGALVSEVIADSPADGLLQAGDVIVEFDGQEVESSRDLPRLVAAVKSGKTADIKVLRDAQEKTLAVKIGRHENSIAMSETQTDAENTSTKKLGVTVAPLTETARSDIGVGTEAQGVVITSLAPSGPAARAGLQVGDVIERVGGEDISNPGTLKAALQSEKTDPALVLINRNGQKLFIAVEIA